MKQILKAIQIKRFPENGKAFQDTVSYFSLLVKITQSPLHPEVKIWQSKRTEYLTLVHADQELIAKDQRYYLNKNKCCDKRILRNM